MTRVLVLYHSTYGHIEKMANAEAEGAGSVEGTDISIRRVPELVSDEKAREAGYKIDQDASIASVDELEEFDAIVVGAVRATVGLRRRWQTSSTRPAVYGRAEH